MVSPDQLQNSSLTAAFVSALYAGIRLLEGKKGNNAAPRRVTELEERIASLESRYADFRSFVEDRLATLDAGGADARRSIEHRRREIKELVYRVDKLSSQVTGQSDA